MKKILVVFTGGTIGSVAAGGTIDTAATASYKLLQKFKEVDGSPGSVQFDSLQPLQILSENLAPAAWSIIIEAIEAAQPENYDGIIITHGTDTLAYTACALSFYFNRLNKPMLLVSSDYPLDNPDGNGLANFCCAVEFIKQGMANGVFVPYRNRGQAMHVHLGSRLTCSLQLSGDFYSVRNQPCWQFDGGSFKSIESSSQILAKRQVAEFGQVKPIFSNKILMIKPYPGLNYRHFDIEKADVVLHDLYHSGTACATGQWGKEHSLLEFLRHCRQQSVPVYLAPAFKSDNAYQSTRELMAEGATMAWNMSIEAAYVKLALAYGNFSGRDEIDAFLAADLILEHLQSR